MLNCVFSVAGMLLVTTSRRLAVAVSSRSERTSQDAFRVNISSSQFSQASFGNLRYLLVEMTNRLLASSFFFFTQVINIDGSSSGMMTPLLKLRTVLFSSTLSTCTNDNQHLLTRRPQRWWTLHNTNETQWLHIVERWTEHKDREQLLEVCREFLFLSPCLYIFI